jgi:hypothetical protein
VVDVTSLAPSPGYATFEDGGREIVYRQDGSAGESLVRKVYVPEDRSFARILIVIDNLSSETISGPHSSATYLPPMTVLATGSGDTEIGVDDAWIAVRQDSSLGSAWIAEVIAGPSPAKGFSTVTV